MRTTHRGEQVKSYVYCLIPSLVLVTACEVRMVMEQPEAPSAPMSTPTAPPADPCRERVSDALDEYPDCPELMRHATAGSCIAEPAWQSALDTHTGEQHRTMTLGYCAFLEMSARAR